MTMLETPRSNPNESVQPDDNTRIVDIMSRSVRTVRDDEQVLAIVPSLRRIGHEGYPVVDAAGRVVGLLTLSIADRTAEQGLEYLVRDVMIVGDVVVSEDDLVTSLAKRMSDSGWGQIPVVNAKGVLVGIITRTDLITYWANRQSLPDDVLRLSDSEISATLGQDNADLIALMGRAAEKYGVRLYIVGGIVRDLLLKRPNLDIDFVVEGDAIDFAEKLKEEFGGQVIAFRPFGTAKWALKDADRLPCKRDNLPYHVDLATARDEFYERPAALPTVYQSSIRPDLARRDFTINTLAVQLNPPTKQGRVIDIFGGVADLRAGVIRVLHSVSFAEDPTRILRALRFAGRLGFRIEARTDDQIDRARLMLRRVTGERLRNELRVLFGERHAPITLKHMSERGILTAIHPDFQIDAGIDRLARWKARADDIPDWVRNVDQNAFVWGLLLASLPPNTAAAVCDRLQIGKTLTEQIVRAVELVKEPNLLSAVGSRPSQISARLDRIDDVSLAVTWAWLHVPALIRYRLSQYVERWRAIQPLTTGHTLRTLGLLPGPCYKRLLDCLRDERRDGNVSDADEEKTLVLRLVSEGFCG